MRLIRSANCVYNLFKQVLAKQVYSFQHMVTHTQHCFTDKVTLKLTVYGGDTCPHQQKELHRQEYIPVMRFFQHPNVFTSRKINGTAVISLVFISKQYEYELLFSSLPTAQFKLKICSLSKGLICHRFELWPCFFWINRKSSAQGSKKKIKKIVLFIFLLHLNSAHLLWLHLY